MIIECSVEKNAQNKQLNVIVEDSFPLAAYYNDMEHFAARQIPWHFHDEMEMIYVKDGELDVYAGQTCIHLCPGDGLFINSGVLHQVIQTSKDTCIAFSFLISKNLFGAEGSVYDKRYITPLITNHNLPYMVLGKETASCIESAYMACHEESFGYEIIAREQLMKVCLTILKEANISTLSYSKSRYPEDERIKQMMNYLKTHYDEPITLKDLAHHVNISEREVQRCFKRNIKETPMQILMKYRLMKACELLGTTTFNVTDIAAQCGFMDASYFAKIFKRMFHMTALAYRKMMQGKEPM